MADMNDSTEHDHVDVKKMRDVPDPVRMSQLSIETALREIHKTAQDVETFIGIATEASITDNLNAHYDRLDAIQLMMKHAHEAINTTWGLAEDLAKTLGVDVHAKEEENEGEPA